MTKEKTLFRRLGRRRGRGAFGGGALFDDLHRPDRALVEGEQRQRKGQLTENVGRRQIRGDDEGDDDKIAALGVELIGGDDADATEQGQDHRQLEGDAEGQHQLHHQRQIVLDLGQQLDARLPRPAHLLHAQRKPRQHRPDHEIDHHRSHQEEHRGGDQIRQERLLLVAVKAGRDEHVDLRGDHRERNEGAAEGCDLELHDEIFEQARVDKFRILRTGDPDVRPSENVVDLLGEEETTDHRDDECSRRLDQPRAQLDQVIHQRRLGRLDLLLFVFVAHAGRSVLSGCAVCAAGSLFAGSAPAGSRSLRSTAATGAAISAEGAASLTAKPPSSGGSAFGSGSVFGSGLASSERSISLLVASRSLRTSLSGSKLFTSCAISSTCFFRSAISASRIASWNWFWKSAAMPRTLRVYWPSVRNTPGSSFGPITISATTPISRNSLQLMSNMKTLRTPRPPAACLAGRGDRREGAASA